MENENKPVNSKDHSRILILVAILVAVGIKIILLLTKSVPFNSDEAIVTLMARHILQGERPVFFYGQAYMGSLDAWLTASVMSLVDDPVLSIRLVQIFLYAGFLISLGWLARKWLHEPAYRWILVFLAAVPPVVVTLYTSASLGGYGEVLLLGNLILGWGYDVTLGGKERSLWRWAALGLAGGLGFWTLGMTGVYLLTVGIWGIFRFRWKQIPAYGLVLLMFMVGSLPWWVNLLQTHGAPLGMLLSGAYSDTDTIVDHILGIFLFGIPTIFGLRHPWSAEWLSPVLAFWGLVLTLAAAVYFLRRQPRKMEIIQSGGRSILWTMVIVLLAVLVLSPYGRDPTGRYFLPLIVPLIFFWGAFVIGAWKQNKIWGMVGLALFLAFNGTATIQAALSPDRITTQFDPITRFDNSYDAELMSFLREHGAQLGYSNYWVSYRFAALSDEQIIYSPRMPDKEDMRYTSMYNRYPAYDQQVNNAPDAAYITTLHPALDAILRDNFRRLGVSWQEATIGPYQVFYSFSRKVTPQEIIYPEVKS
jgi:4-amino-4-deoxy-L-arabinose transferase-like glycosyltransferase